MCRIIGYHLRYVRLILVHPRGSSGIKSQYGLGGAYGGMDLGWDFVGDGDYVCLGMQG